MSLSKFTESELKAAVDRGVHQLVVIDGPPIPADKGLKLFVVKDEACRGEALDAVLARLGFDHQKPSEVIWFGGCAYRTIDSILATLRFIASLPNGSGVLLDYVSERISAVGKRRATLDALASRFANAAGDVKQFIQPQAVHAMLHGLGFRQISERSDLDNHLVSAVV